MLDVVGTPLRVQLYQKRFEDVFGRTRHVGIVEDSDYALPASADASARPQAVAALADTKELMWQECTEAGVGSAVEAPPVGAAVTVGAARTSAWTSLPCQRPGAPAGDEDRHYQP